MASITLGGNPIQTSGELPKIGSKIADFKLIKTDLSVASLGDFVGKKLLLNIFPSIDTLIFQLERCNKLKYMIDWHTIS